jgi:hypothetical protein
MFGHILSTTPFFRNKEFTRKDLKMLCKETVFYCLEVRITAFPELP